MPKTASYSILPEQTPNFYWARVICSNCQADEDLAFPKGQKVIETECPLCGCRTLEKQKVSLAVG